MTILENYYNLLKEKGQLIIRRNYNDKYLWYLMTIENNQIIVYFSSPKGDKGEKTWFECKNNFEEFHDLYLICCGQKEIEIPF